MQNRKQEQFADSPVPQIMEAVVEVVPSTPQERVLEQIMDFLVHSDHGGSRGSFAFNTTGVRAESYSEALR